MKMLAIEGRTDFRGGGYRCRAGEFRPGSGPGGLRRCNRAESIPSPWPVAWPSRDTVRTRPTTLDRHTPGKTGTWRRRLRCCRYGAGRAPEKSEKAWRNLVIQHGPFRIQGVVADPDRSVEFLGQGAQSRQAEAAADTLPVPGGFAAEKALPSMVVARCVAVKGHDGGGDRKGRTLAGGAGKLAQRRSPFHANCWPGHGGGRRGGGCAGGRSAVAGGLPCDFRCLGLVRVRVGGGLRGAGGQELAEKVPECALMGFG